jgi:hypothetical protein
MSFLRGEQEEEERRRRVQLCEPSAVPVPPRQSLVPSDFFAGKPDSTAPTNRTGRGRASRAGRLYPWLALHPCTDYSMWPYITPSVSATQSAQLSLRLTRFWLASCLFRPPVFCFLPFYWNTRPGDWPHEKILCVFNFIAFAIMRSRKYGVHNVWSGV